MYEEEIHWHIWPWWPWLLTHVPQDQYGSSATQDGYVDQVW